MVGDVTLTDSGLHDFCESASAATILIFLEFNALILRIKCRGTSARLISKIKQTVNIRLQNLPSACRFALCMHVPRKAANPIKEQYSSFLQWGIYIYSRIFIFLVFKKITKRLNFFQFLQNLTSFLHDSVYFSKKQKSFPFP